MARVQRPPKNAAIKSKKVKRSKQETEHCKCAGDRRKRKCPFENEELGRKATQTGKAERRKKNYSHHARKSRGDHPQPAKIVYAAHSPTSAFEERNARKECCSNDSMAEGLQKDTVDRGHAFIFEPGHARFCGGENPEKTIAEMAQG